MSTMAKATALLAALVVAIVVAACTHHQAFADAYLRASQFNAQDWVILVFGSACVGGMAYSLWTQPDSFDWRGIFWLIVGGLMIYSVLGDVPWLKEQSCRITDSRHHVWSSPCYQ